MLSSLPITKVVSRFRQRIFRTLPEDTLPHVITHQRVYIVPTRRGFAFLLTTFLMLIASVNYSLSLGYALCFILTGLFAACLLHTYRNLAGISVEKIDHDNTFAGVDAKFTISLANTLRETRHGIRVGAKNSSKLRVQVAPIDTTDVLLTIPTQKRGSINLGRVTLQSDWPLGLWTCWSYIHAPIKSLVFPKPEADPPPIPSSTMDNVGSRAMPDLEGEVSGLRIYRPGDSIGSIAWKNAAKGMGLQVRTFDSSHCPTRAILSLENTRLNQIERQLSRLCAWVLEAKSEKSEITLQIPGVTMVSSRGESHYNQALESLALYGTEQ